MADSQDPQLTRCYHCRVQSAYNVFKYFDNKKADQPRYQCHNCDKFFTLGDHGRPQGKTYKKKRNEDPEELKGLSRQCTHCGVADNALFKYCNNNSRAQPRFLCLSCNKHFQMRMLGTGTERRLVPTSSQQRSAARRPKQTQIQVQAVSPNEPLLNPCTNTTSCGDGGYQPYDGSFVPGPAASCDPLMTSPWPAEAETSLEEFCSFLDTKLAEPDEIDQANIVNEAGIVAPDDFGAFMVQQGHEAPCVDLPVSEDLGEMVPGFEFHDVMYGTLEASEPPAAASYDHGPDFTWTDNDNTYSMSYADAAADCCRQMDLDMAAHADGFPGSDGSKLPFLATE